MLTLKPAAPRFFAAFGLLALVGAVGLVSSRPAHTAGGPIAVSVANTVRSHDADNPAQQPFQTRLDFDSTTTNSEGTFVVPAGKRLVLENVSAETFSGPMSGVEVYVVTRIAGQPVLHDVGFADKPIDGVLFMPIVPVRLYADGGSTVSVGVIRGGSLPPGSAVGNVVHLSGYLVNVP